MASELTEPSPRSPLNYKRPLAFSAALISVAGCAYLVVLFIAGLLTNFVSIGSINTGTIVLYVLAFILSLIGVLYLLNPLPKNVALAAFLMLGISCLVLTKPFLDINPASQRVREVVILYLGGLPFLFFIQINNLEVRQKLLRTLAIGLIALSVFGIFQGLLGSSLPSSLFMLRGDNIFSVDDNQILRPTGLTGNPIIFSSILVFASAYFAAHWLERRRLRFLIGLAFSLVANYLTYTRASIILVIPVLVFVWLFHNRFHIKHKMAVLIVVIVAIVGGQYLLANGGDLILIQRLQNSDPSSVGSTLVHFTQIRNATEAILAHPFVGLGMGSQGDFVGPENVMVTDGAWWILLLEFGLPLSILIVISLGIVLFDLVKYVLRKDSKHRALAIATLSFHAYIFPANFINSALLGHISYGLYWAVLGLAVAGIT
jgi:hypothetical protein